MRVKQTTPSSGVIPPLPTTTLPTVTIPSNGTPQVSTTLVGCITLPCDYIKPENKNNRVLSPFHKELIAIDNKFNIFAYASGSHFFVAEANNIVNILRNLDAAPDEHNNFTLDSIYESLNASMPHTPELVNLDHTEHITKISFSPDSSIFYVVFESFFEVYSMKQVLGSIGLFDLLQLYDPIAAFTLSDPSDSLITNVIFSPPTLQNPYPLFGVQYYPSQFKIIAFAAQDDVDDPLMSLPDITGLMDKDLNNAIAMHYDQYFKRILIILPSSSTPSTLQLVALYPQLNKSNGSQYLTNMVILGDIPDIPGHLIELQKSLSLPISYNTISSSPSGIFLSTSFDINTDIEAIKGQRSRITLFLEYDKDRLLRGNEPNLYPMPFHHFLSSHPLGDITHDEESLTSRDLSFFKPSVVAAGMFDLGEKFRFRPSNIIHHTITTSNTTPQPSFELDIFNSTDVSWPRLLGYVGKDEEIDVVPESEKMDQNGQKKKVFEILPYGATDDEGSATRYPSITKFDTAYTLSAALSLATWLSPSAIPEEGCLYVDETAILDANHDETFRSNYDNFTIIPENDSTSLQDDVDIVEEEEIVVEINGELEEEMKIKVLNDAGAVSPYQLPSFSTVESTLSHFSMLPPSPLLFVLTTEGTLMILQIKIECGWWRDNWKKVMKIPFLHSSVKPLSLLFLPSPDSELQGTLGQYSLEQDQEEEKTNGDSLGAFDAQKDKNDQIAQNVSQNGQIGGFGVPAMPNSFGSGGFGFGATPQDPKQENSFGFGASLQQQTSPFPSQSPQKQEKTSLFPSQDEKSTQNNWQKCPQPSQPESSDSIFGFKSSIGDEYDDYDDEEGLEGSQNGENGQKGEKSLQNLTSQLHDVQTNHHYNSHSFIQTGSLDATTRQTRANELISQQKGHGGTVKGHFSGYNDMKTPQQAESSDVKVQDCIKIDPTLPKNDKGIEYLVSLLETTNGYVNSIAKDANASFKTISEAFGTGKRDQNGFFIEETMTLHDLVVDTSDEMNAIVSGLKARSHTIVECQGQQMKTYLALSNAIKQAKLIKTQKAPSANIKSIDLASCYLLIYGKYMLYKNLLQHQRDAIQGRAELIGALFPVNSNSINNANNNINLPTQQQQRNNNKYTSYLLDNADSGIDSLLIAQTLDPAQIPRGNIASNRHQHIKLNQTINGKNGLYQNGKNNFGANGLEKNNFGVNGLEKNNFSGINFNGTNGAPTKVLTRPRRRLKVGMIGIGLGDEGEENDDVNTTINGNNGSILLNNNNNNGLNKTINGPNGPNGQNGQNSLNNTINQAYADYNSLTNKYFSYATTISQALSVLHQRMLSFDARIQCFLARIHHGKVENAKKAQNGPNSSQNGQNGAKSFQNGQNIPNPSQNFQNGLPSFKSALQGDVVYESILSSTRGAVKSGNLAYQATDGTIDAFYSTLFGPQITPLSPPSTIQSLLTQPFALYKNAPQIITVEAFGGEDREESGPNNAIKSPLPLQNAQIKPQNTQNQQIITQNQQIQSKMTQNIPQQPLVGTKTVTPAVGLNTKVNATGGFAFGGNGANNNNINNNNNNNNNTMSFGANKNTSSLHPNPLVTSVSNPAKLPTDGKSSNPLQATLTSSSAPGKMFGQDDAVIDKKSKLGEKNEKMIEKSEKFEKNPETSTLSKTSSNTTFAFGIDSPAPAGGFNFGGVGTSTIGDNVGQNSGAAAVGSKFSFSTPTTDSSIKPSPLLAFGAPLAPKDTIIASTTKQPKPTQSFSFGSANDDDEEEEEDESTLRGKRTRTTTNDDKPVSLAPVTPKKDEIKPFGLNTAPGGTSKDGISNPFVPKDGQDVAKPFGGFGFTATPAKGSSNAFGFGGPIVPGTVTADGKTTLVTTADANKPVPLALDADKAPATAPGTDKVPATTPGTDKVPVTASTTDLAKPVSGDFSFTTSATTASSPDKAATDATKPPAAGGFVFGTVPVANAAVDAVAKVDEKTTNPANPATATTIPAKVEEKKTEGVSTSLPVLDVAPPAVKAPTAAAVTAPAAPAANANLFATTTPNANAFATITAPNAFATTTASTAAPNLFATPAPNANLFATTTPATNQLANTFGSMGGLGAPSTPAKPPVAVAGSFGFSNAATATNTGGFSSNTNLFQTPNNNINNNNNNNTTQLANIPFGSPTTATNQNPLANPMGSSPFGVIGAQPQTAQPSSQANGQFGTGFGGVTSSFNSNSYSAMGIGTIGSGSRPAPRSTASTSGFTAFASGGGNAPQGGGNGFASMASSSAPTNGFAAAGAGGASNGFAAMANNGAGGFGGNNSGASNGFAAMAGSNTGGFGGNNNNAGGFGGNSNKPATNGFAAMANNGAGGFGGNTNNNNGFAAMGNPNNNAGGYGTNNNNTGNGFAAMANNGAGGFGGGFGNNNNNNNNNGFGGFGGF